MRCNMFFGSCVMLGSVFALPPRVPDVVFGRKSGSRNVVLESDCCSWVAGPDRVWSSIGAAERLQVTSALPEPDSLLTQMALVTEESRDGRRTGCARVRNWSGHLPSEIHQESVSNQRQGLPVSEQSRDRRWYSSLKSLEG